MREAGRGCDEGRAHGQSVGVGLEQKLGQSDAANELEVEIAPAGTRTTYLYDADGNTTLKNAAGSRTTYTWDGESRLICIALPAGGLMTMTYDGHGLRRKKEEVADTVNFLWDLQRVLLETNAGGTTVAHYTLSEDVYGDLLSQRRDSTSSFYHFDALGSTDRLTSSAAAVTDSYIYS